MSRSILVVDDDSEIRAIITEVLRDEGYEVEVATNGAEGLAIIKQAQPSLVLLDMRMPVLNGWELVRKLVQDGIEVPIIAMTAAQDARHWAHEIGAVGVLAKPFDLVELLQAVERVV